MIGEKFEEELFFSFWLTFFFLVFSENCFCYKDTTKIVIHLWLPQAWMVRKGLPSDMTQDVISVTGAIQMLMNKHAEDRNRSVNNSSQPYYPHLNGSNGNKKAS